MVSTKRPVHITDLADLAEYLELSTAATGAKFGIPDTVVLESRKNPTPGEELPHPTLALHVRLVKWKQPDWGEASFQKLQKALKKHKIEVPISEFAPLFGLERTAYNRWEGGEKGTQKTTALWQTFIECLEQDSNPKRFFQEYREMVLMEGRLRGIENVFEAGHWASEKQED